MPTTNGVRMVIEKYDGFGGNYVDSQYLGNSYATGKPYVFDRMLMKMFATKNSMFGSKAMMGLIGSYAKKGIKEIDNEIFQWYLQGAEEKFATSLGLVDGSITAVGLNNSEFEFKLDLDYYSRPDVLMGRNSRWPIAIVRGPIKVGSSNVYVGKLQTDDPTAFLSPEDFALGQPFSKVWTSISSESNSDWGTQQTPSSFKLESQVGAFSQAFEVTDKALREQGRMGIKFIYTDPQTGKEKIVDNFLPTYEAIMYDTLYDGMDAAMIYGRKSTYTNDGNKYWTKTMPGIREQLQDSWNKYYSGVPSVDVFKDFLLDVSISRVDESEREYVATTGSLGSLFLHDALAAEAASFLTVDHHFIKDFDRSKRLLSFGAQFSHYSGPEGVSFSLMKNPRNDSFKYEKTPHPDYPDLPMDSARYTFLNFGKYKGEQNIQVLSVKDTYAYGHRVGTVGPNGVVKGGPVSQLKAAYDVWVQGTRGIVMFDPTSGGEIIPAVN